MLTVGSLFSGIGGLDLGLERAGMRVVWQAEIDPYASAVLRKHWPDVPNLGDLRAVETFPPADVLCGGFPCQPVSLAGQRRAQADDRWLWPEFARVIRLVRPRYVVVENVPGLFTAGFGPVLGELAAIGYDAEWESVPALALGAPHRRWRLFLVAYPGSGQLRNESGWSGGASGQGASIARDDGATGPVANPHGRRRRKGQPDLSGQPQSDPAWRGATVANADRSERRALTEGRHEPDRDDAGRQEATGGPWVGREDMADAHGEGESQPRRLVFQERRWPGDSDWWATEPDLGRVAHGVPSRVDRLRTLGNAVVPQVAEWVGRQIMNAEARS